MSTANRVIKNSFWLYGKMGITMFISLYTTRLILDSLGASDFGIFNIVGGAIAMLGFLNAAMASATQRFMSFSEGEGDKEKQKSIFNISVVLHSAIAVVVGLLLLVAGYFFFNGILNIPADRISAAKVVYGSLIVSTMFTVMNVPYDAVMNAHENMKYYAVVGVFESFLKLTVAFICVYTSYDKLVVYGILMACIPLVTMTMMRIYCHRKYDECVIKLKKYYKKSIFREMISFAGWNLLASVVVVVSNHGIGIVINMFFGTVINAAQGVANQLSGQLQAVTMAMSKAINPVIMKKAGMGELQGLIVASGISSKILFLLMSLIAIPAIVIMPTLMELWLGEVPQYASFFCQCLLIVALCEQITGGLYSSILATGDIKEVMIFKSLLRALYLPVIYILFRFGLSPVGAYVVQIIIQGIINAFFVNLYYAHKKAGFQYSYYLSQVFLPAISVSVIVFVVSAFLAGFFDGLYKIIVVFSVTTILFIPLIYIIAFNTNERAIARQIINSISSKLKKI